MGSWLSWAGSVLGSCPVQILPVAFQCQQLCLQRLAQAWVGLVGAYTPNLPCVLRACNGIAMSEPCARKDKTAINKITTCKTVTMHMKVSEI